ncbi:MAG: type III-A CRISPR-associated RAMP protein Csm4 [Selenomonadaceae bacterium]|nr:type III-A CRISPR-associated RAMP protein Csm4 [Selenomonadaceae bacterium]
MEYHIYKLSFHYGVHFGETRLESAAMTFQADRLFSALCMEALTIGEAALEKLVSLAQDGRIVFSDAFPYAEKEYFLPKPLIRVEGESSDDPRQRKRFKKLEYVPMHLFGKYIEGKCTIQELESLAFGIYDTKTSVYLEPGKDAEPYRIGVFAFHENCGLYFFVGYEEKQDLHFVEELLEMLAFSGIGGRRVSGLGRFELHPGKVQEDILASLKNEYETYMSLSISLPQSEEMDFAVEGARYLLLKRSGFVASENYAPEFRHKRDIYAFSAGSCFVHKFSGGVRDVSNGGNHPVYRYLKPMFMGIRK